MNMIVFSYNRALQLEAFLKSVRRHVRADKLEINVIYNSGGGKYEEAYLSLKREYHEVTFTRRHKINSVSMKYFFTYKKNLYRYFKHANLRKHLTNFKELVESIVAESPHETVAFFTDDSIFREDIYINSSILKEVNSTTVYSFRHGLNISPQPASIKPYTHHHHIYNVKSEGAGMEHWTHLFSIDGHVYSRKLLLPVFQKLNYINPNSFEGFVNHYLVHEMRNVCTRLIFPASNALVGFELNKVQTFVENNNLNFSVEQLNDKFMAGFRLSYLFDESAVADFRPPLLGIEFSNRKTGEVETIHFAEELAAV